MKKQMFVTVVVATMLASSMAFAGFGSARGDYVKVLKDGHNTWAKSNCTNSAVITNVPYIDSPISKSCLVSQSLPREDIDGVRSALATENAGLSYYSWKFYDANQTQWRSSVDFSGYYGTGPGTMVTYGIETSSLNNDDYGECGNSTNIMKVLFSFVGKTARNTFNFLYPSIPYQW